MRTYLIDDLFPGPALAKPRELRQTWVKDIGFLEAPYGEKMGLVELADFLEVAAPRLDFAKFISPVLIHSPREWFIRKVETYSRYGIVSYLDHTYFRVAHSSGQLVKAIAAVGELGVPAMEFMNVGNTIAPDGWRELVQLATDHGIQVIFEFHPPSRWDPVQPVLPSSAEDILRAAAPALEAGAIKLMIDHDVLDLLADRAEEELGKLVSELGLQMLVLEVASTPDGKTKWREHLEFCFRALGPDCNVSNIMPSQVMFIESMRQLASGSEQMHPSFHPGLPHSPASGP